ncbi:pentapeptide repeat-containing protein [Catenulispora subtropica]|uniref:Pentapeptide repeat protein n=1 Tax=Catenulispora subtropica TaxID=450798 RepID=A0ABN2SQS1_9ACTN
MSAATPFRGKWRVRDDVHDYVLRIDGTLGSGTALLLYRVGGTYNGFEYVYCALQSDTAEPTQPSGLADCYLSPVPYSGNAYKANGVGNTSPTAQQKAVKFLFKDDYGEKTTDFAAAEGPKNGLFGLWAYTSGGQYWGWTTANQPPTSYVYSARVDVPSASHARTWLNNVVPQGADYSWVDISGEDYTGISMVGAKFPGADLSKADFRGSDLSTADFRNVHTVAGANLTGMTLAGAVFTGVDLSGIDFTGSNLSGADFRGVKSLHGTVFTDTDLTNAHFENLDLTGMVFSGATLPGVHFNGTNLSQTTFSDSADKKADLSAVDFTVSKTIHGARFSCELLDSDLSGMDLKDVDFTGAILKGTNFHGCDLRPATFSSPPTWSDDANHLTNLSQAVVDYSTLGLNWSFMNLIEAKILNRPKDLTGLNAQSSLMQGWELSSHNLADAILSDTNLCGATLSYCNFKLAKMDGAQLQKYDASDRAAVLTGSQMEDVNLSGANLTGTSLSGVYLYGQSASLSKAIVQDTDFSGAYLEGAAFRSVADNQCEGVNFDYACLVNADFTGTKLITSPNGESVHMNKACLQGANFTDAQLYGADLSAAAVDENPGVIMVTIPTSWPDEGKGETVPIEYSQGTIGIETATNSSTTCPAGSLGPCSGAALHSDQAPRKWPVKQ